MKANPLVLRATEEHAAAIAPHLRRYDDLEGVLNLAAVQVIRDSIRRSAEAYTWMVQGRPAAIFGVVPTAIVGGDGELWVVTTPIVERDVRTFWLGSKIFVAQMERRYPRLVACVDERFVVSANWLRKLGFRVDEPTLFRGLPFCRCVRGADQ